MTTPHQPIRIALAQHAVRDKPEHNLGACEAACRRALILGSHSYKSIESILKHRLDDKPLAEQQELALPEDHDNIRGPSYYH